MVKVDSCLTILIGIFLIAACHVTGVASKAEAERMIKHVDDLHNGLSQLSRSARSTNRDLSNLIRFTLECHLGLNSPSCYLGQMDHTTQEEERVRDTHNPGKRSMTGLQDLSRKRRFVFAEAGLHIFLEKAGKLKEDYCQGQILAFQNHLKKQTTNNQIGKQLIVLPFSLQAKQPKLTNVHDKDKFSITSLEEAPTRYVYDSLWATCFHTLKRVCLTRLDELVFIAAWREQDYSQTVLTKIHVNFRSTTECPEGFGMNDPGCMSRVIDHVRTLRDDLINRVTDVGKRSGESKNVSRIRRLLDDLMRKRGLLKKITDTLSEVQDTLITERKRSCNLNLGFHCQTEQYSAIADMYNWLQSSLSPGKRKREAAVKE